MNKEVRGEMNGETKKEMKDGVNGKMIVISIIVDVIIVRVDGVNATTRRSTRGKVVVREL